MVARLARQRSLNCSHSSRVGVSRRLRRWRRARSGTIALQHETIEIGAQRRAVIGGERRAHPGGHRRVPRRLQIALRRARRRPASRRPGRWPDRVASSSLCIRVTDALIDCAVPIDLRARLGVAVEGARPPVEHALARVTGQQIAPDSSTDSKHARPRRRTRSSKNSSSPRPTMYSARSRAGKRCGSMRRRRSRALTRSSVAELARKRSR